MTIKEALIKGFSILQKSPKTTNSDLDCRILMSHVMDMSLEKMLMSITDEMSLKQKVKFLDLIERRSKGEPIAYLTGKKHFWKSEFVVNSDVLIPRPDTETLIEEILTEYEKDEKFKILELGVGSGAIIISLLQEYKDAKAVGVDISLEALEVCKKNAALLNVDDRLKLFHSIWYTNLPPQKFDVIVSNPPYISALDPLVDRKVAEFEPGLALFTELGYESYFEIAKKAKEYLKEGGHIYLEIGHDQAELVTGLLKSFRFEQIRVVKDIAGKDRVVTGVYKGSE